MEQNRYGQHGQGLWIFKLLSVCGISEGTIFEAGAATPDHPFTNSGIFTDNNYTTLLCESDKDSCLEWEKVDNKLISIINKSIKYERKGLEDLLIEMKSPYSLDALFLDIDGGEYHLLEGLDSFRPKIICVEYDNTYPLSIDYTPLRIRAGDQCSSTSMFKLMRSKGYIYIRSIFDNLIFISEEFLARNQNTFKRLDIDHGDDFFYADAPKGLYNLCACVCLQKDGSGGKGIDFYGTKVRKLISNDHLNDAKNFFDYLSRSFQDLIPILQDVKGEQYLLDYVKSMESFNSSFRWLLYV